MSEAVAPAPPATAPATAPTGPKPLEGGALWLAAFGLALTNFVVILDTTITNVSVPHIAGSLAVSPSQGTWTITSYAVAEAITVPLSGWLAGRFGTLRVLIASLTGFALFSMLCGLARTIEVLVLLRVMQGLCGGPLMPMTQTMMLRIFPPQKMGAANALWGVTAIFAPILGPLIGGYISDNWSWPWIFYINIPVVAACLVIILRLLRPYESATRRERIDVIGLALLILFVAGLQLVLDLGREYDWFGSTMIVALALTSAISFGLFVIWELTEEHPAVNLRVLRHRSLWVGLSALGLGYGSVFSMIVLIPLWLQSAIGYTSSEAGHVMALMGVLAVMLSPAAGQLIQKLDVRLLVSLGMAWIASISVMRMFWNSDGAFWDYALPQLLHGAGMPFFFIGLMTMSLVDVPESEIPSAAGLLSFTRTLSGAAGTALGTSLWDEATREARVNLASTLNGADGTMATMQAGGMSAGQARAAVERLVDVQASTIGTFHVYAITAVLLLIAMGLVWLTPRPVLRGGPGAAAH